MKNKAGTSTNIGVTLKIIFTFIIVACVAVLYWIPDLAWVPYRMPDGVYVENTSNGMNVLVSNGYTFSIYYIYEDAEQSTYYGNKFVYKVDSGDAFHRVISNLYYLAEDSVPLRKRYAILDDSIQKKAYITFHTTETWVWNRKGTVDNGQYKAFITEGVDSISIGDLNFTKVNDGTATKNFIDLVLNAFDGGAKEVK